MKKELLTARQGMSIIILFIFGSSVVMGVNTQAGQDAWISLIMAILFSIPLLGMYGRIMVLSPEQDMFQIAIKLFGPFIGKGIVLLYSWYALHLGALVIRNFSEFIGIVAMPETPQFPLMIAFLSVVIYMAKSGVEILGKWSAWVAPFVVIIVLATISLSLDNMDFTNLQPVMAHSLGEIGLGAFKMVTFPIGEIVLFLPLATAIKKEDSPYRIYYWGVLLSSIVLLLVIIRNIGSIGAPMMQYSYFPSYITARIINLGDFLSRIEGTISVNFILAGVTKVTVCLLAATKGISYLLNLKNQQTLLMPVGLWMLALCAIVYDNAMDMFSFINIYQFYAIPFQFLLPLIIWIASEIKGRNAAN